jgi:hypothetical protein
LAFSASTLTDPNFALSAGSKLTLAAQLSLHLNSSHFIASFKLRNEIGRGLSGFGAYFVAAESSSKPKRFSRRKPI